MNGATPYPYNLAGSRKARTMVTLDMLGPDTTFQEIFQRDIRDVLQSCSQRIESSLVRANTHLGGTFPSPGEYEDAIDALSQCFSTPITFKELMEVPQATWPAGVKEKTKALLELGCYINFHLVPDEGKNDIITFFSPEGDDFLGNQGQLSIREYFESPRSAYTEENLALLYKGRRLGVLICHPDATAAEADKEGRCWNGINCQDTSLNLVCDGNTPSSDPCPS